MAERSSSKDYGIMDVSAFCWDFDEAHSADTLGLGG
jgi:hypothetical protein